MKLLSRIRWFFRKRRARRALRREGWTRYQNPDPRCTYPFEPGPLGYCWSYANHKDGDPRWKDIDKICRGCDMWKE